MSKTPRKINMIFASTKDLGIGKNNNLPWGRLKGDLEFFKSITSFTKETSKVNSIIMGFKTFESLGKKPLPKRMNLVLTSKPKHVLENYKNDSVRFFSDIDEAVEFSAESEQIDKAFIIGGGQIFNTVLKNQDKYDVENLYWTRILKSFDSDVKIDRDSFNNLTSKLDRKRFSKTRVDQGDINYDFSVFSKTDDSYFENQVKDIQTKIKPSEEMQYLNLLKEVIETGEERPDRTNTGILSLFGKSLRFDLSESFPLLTTKAVFFKAVAEELFWFIKGQTDANILSSKGVKIWDGNGSREFLDSRGLFENPVGDLGPVYGFQWRHFGAPYEGTQACYDGKGVDQLLQIINDLRADRFSRRHIVSAWNPVDLPKMALPPCHVLFQFYVTKDDRLSCSLYQRSADIGLGVPFNIASYSLLVCLMADLLGLKRGEFVHFIGDAHVYLNHIEELQKQLLRDPYPFPILQIDKKGPRLNLWEYTMDDIVLKNYYPHSKIKMKMAV